MIENLSAITLFTHDMARAVDFYRKLGFQISYGGEQADFTSFHAGPSFLNLMRVSLDQPLGWWGRAIFYVTDVDATHAQALAAGLQPSFAPQDAPWASVTPHFRSRWARDQLRPAFAAEASEDAAPARNGQSAACASTGKGIGHQNGVFSVGTGRQKGDWRAHQLLDVRTYLLQWPAILPNSEHRRCSPSPRGFQTGCALACSEGVAGR